MAGFYATWVLSKGEKAVWMPELPTVESGEKTHAEGKSGVEEGGGIPMTYCQICDEPMIDDDRYVTIDGHTLVVCRRCSARVDEEHKVTGRFHVEACKHCRHIKTVYFQPYKPKGRPKGSKTDPIKRARRKGMAALETFGKGA